MNSIGIIPRYLALLNDMCGMNQYICYSTNRGRRLIIKVLDRLQCNAVNNQFNPVTFADGKEAYYDNPQELLEAYFAHDDVYLIDIFITGNRPTAIDYLFSKDT